MPENQPPAARKASISSDTKWIIGTLIGSLLGMSTILATVMTILIGTVNSRIDDVAGEVNELRTEMREEIGELRTEMREDIGQLRTEMRENIGQLRTEMREDNRSIRTRLRGVEVALGRIDRTFLPTAPEPPTVDPGQPGTPPVLDQAPDRESPPE